MVISNLIIKKDFFRTENISLKITLGLIAISFFVLNLFTPYIGDDYLLKCNLNNFIDIVVQNYNHYFLTNGRLVSHFFSRLFLLLPKIWFNIFNTFIYIIFLLLIYKHATLDLAVRKNKAYIFLILINCSIFLIGLRWGHVFLWLDGACNYLWTMVFILAFLLLYRKPEYTEKISPVMLFGGGVVVGWCNENSSGGAILFCIISLLSLHIRCKKIPKSLLIGLFGAILGFSLMLLAPGNMIRLAEYVDNRPFYEVFLERFFYITNKIYENYKFIFIAMIILFIFLLTEKNRGQSYISILYSFVAIAIAYALVLSPLSLDRSFLGTTVFLMIAVVRLLALFSITYDDFRLSTICVSVIVFLFLVPFANACFDIIQYKIASDARDDYVINQREHGYTNIVVPEINELATDIHNSAYNYNILVDEWRESYANFFDVTSINTVSIEAFNNIFKNGNGNLINCRNIYQYLKLIDNDNYLILMSVNDDSSGAIDENIVVSMRNLGLQTDLRKNLRWSYIAVINKGRVIHEDYANELLNYYDTIDGNTIEIISSGKIYNKGNIASIKINGYEYAKNILGLNIVVYDYIKDQVIDRVTFNTWEGLEASR